MKPKLANGHLLNFRESTYSGEGANSDIGYWVTENRCSLNSPLRRLGSIGITIIKFLTYFPPQIEAFTLHAATPLSSAHLILSLNPITMGTVGISVVPAHPSESIVTVMGSQG
ncbi:hypothetical protein Pelo_16873 [Pelomyxa schiedti]|nr:hypothetical protein Pelo_16873 [Pelomyxa schiedti]